MTIDKELLARFANLNADEEAQRKKAFLEQELNRVLASQNVAQLQKFRDKYFELLMWDQQQRLENAIEDVGERTAQTLIEEQKRKVDREKKRREEYIQRGGDDIVKKAYQRENDNRISEMMIRTLQGTVEIEIQDDVLIILIHKIPNPPRDTTPESPDEKSLSELVANWFFDHTPPSVGSIPCLKKDFTRRILIVAHAETDTQTQKIKPAKNYDTKTYKINLQARLSAFIDRHPNIIDYDILNKEMLDSLYD